MDDVLDPKSKSLGVNIAKKGIDMVDSNKNAEWFVVLGRNVDILEVFQADSLYHGGGLEGRGDDSRLVVGRNGSRL